MVVSFDADEWANAPEFIPSSSSNASFLMENCASGTTAPLSYAQAVNPNAGQVQQSFSSQDPLCPYAEATGICKRTNCTYLHGEICDMCSRAALHPYSEELRKKHTNVSKIILKSFIINIFNL